MDSTGQGTTERSAQAEGVGTDRPPMGSSDPAEVRASRRKFALGASFVGIVLTFVAAKWNLPGIGNDASSYIAIADRFAASGQLGYFLEPKLGLWPPGFPVTLALFRWAFDLDPAITALWINALSLIPFSLTSLWLLERTTANDKVIRAGVLIAVLGPATLSQTYMVQTEPTFGLIVLASFIALVKFGDSHRDPSVGSTTAWKWFALAVVLQWAAFMDRYVGLVAIGAGALWLVFETLSGSPLATRFRNGVLFFLASNLVPGIWIIRNTIVTDSQFGPRDTPLATFKGNTADATTSLGQFIHGFSRYEPMEGLGRLLSIALALAVGAFAVLCLQRLIASRPTPVGGASGAPALLRDLVGGPLGLLLIYAGAHWAYMVWSASTIAFDPVNTRYLAPMFVPAMIAGLVLVDRATFSWPNARPGDLLTRAAKIGLVALVVVQLVIGVVRVSASYWTDEAQNYNSPEALDIRNSPVLDALPDDCGRLYSNFPELTYLAGFEAQRSPRKTKFASSDRLHELRDLTRFLESGDETACLIWVDEDRYSTPLYQWQFEELDERLVMEELDADSHVAVYEITGVR